MTREDFKKWARETNATRPPHLQFFYYCNAVICYNPHNGEVGVARCHSDDEKKFDFGIGEAIATARCRDKKIPTIDIEKPVCELKNGDRVKIGNVERIFIGRIIVGKYVFGIPDTITTKIYSFNEYDTVTVIE